MSLRDRRPAPPVRTAAELVAETLTAARPAPPGLVESPSPSLTQEPQTAPPPSPRRDSPSVRGPLPRVPARTPRRVKETPSQRVVRHVVLVTPEQDAWIRKIRIAAIQEEERELSLSVIVRAALDQMRQRGGWRELRELLVATADAGPQRGRRLDH